MPLDDQVYYFLSSKGSSKLSAGLPPRLLEYNKLKFFWKNFGLNKHDLLKEDPKWVEEVFLVGLGVNKVENEKVAAGGNTPISNRSFSGNVKREKLL